jgi:hypothetical protein
LTAAAWIEAEVVAQHLAAAIRFRRLPSLGPRAAQTAAFEALHGWLAPSAAMLADGERVGGHSLLYTW